jgi:hypothetical protein
MRRQSKTLKFEALVRMRKSAERLKNSRRRDAEKTSGQVDIYRHANISRHQKRELNN